MDRSRLIITLVLIGALIFIAGFTLSIMADRQNDSDTRIICLMLASGCIVALLVFFVVNIVLTILRK